MKTNPSAALKAVAVLVPTLAAIPPSMIPAAAAERMQTGPARMPSAGPSVVVAKPDLTFSFAGYTLNSCAIQGKYTRMKISATVRNDGEGVATVNDWGIAVAAYASMPLDVPSTYTGVKPIAHGPKTLNPGTSFSVNLDLIIGPAKNNQGYPVYVQVDSSNKVAESNENNNNRLVVHVPANKQYCTAK